MSRLSEWRRRPYEPSRTSRFFDRLVYHNYRPEEIVEIWASSPGHYPRKVFTMSMRNWLQGGDVPRLHPLSWGEVHPKCWAPIPWTLRVQGALARAKRGLSTRMRLLKRSTLDWLGRS